MRSLTSCPSRFAFVIPVYNHEQMVGQVVEQALNFGFPVVVVDDGSTDRTAEILKTISGITLFRHKENLGKGAALKTGFAEAQKVADWAITVDADGQHNLEDASLLMQAISGEQKTLVIGMRKGMKEDTVPWTSRFGRGFSNFWVLTSGGPWLKDTQSGFRIYPLPEVCQLKTKGCRYQFEVEILVKASWASIPIIEIPITVDYAPGGKRISHFKPFQDFMRNSLVFTRLITQRILIPYPLRKKLTFISKTQSDPK